MDIFSWVQDPKVKLSLQKTIAGVRVEQKEAITIISLLAQEGITHIRRILGKKFYTKNFPTNRHGNTWAYNQPSGLVDHYTADIHIRGTLMWFSNMDRGLTGGNSSAHYIIDKDGTIITLVDPLTTIAWHATVANSTSIGIEHVCAGLLKKSSSGKFMYLNNVNYPEEFVPILQEINKEFWEPFTVEQLFSNLAVKRLLIQAIPTLREEKFTDHQSIDTNNKIDCGPLWPLKELNKLAFSFVPLVEEFDWMKYNIMTKDALSNFKLTVLSLIG